ncbi:MAG: squalene/phytoene synthase family protein [Chloroflexota bacterium]|nr:squalene/phytoene synthase family protein [Chloroflexota bacterium]
MTLQIQPAAGAWEAMLLDWAYEPLTTRPPARALRPHDAALAAAYATCDEITRENSRTFYLASGLLPPDKRQAARALYAFCRVSDNLVDMSQGEDRAEALEAWRALAMSDDPPRDQPVALAWADARARFNIPAGYARQLIDGVAQDLHKVRYANFDELAAYSYGVASTVGLMAMYIVGFRNEDAIPYAIRLGVALQVTNILRDVGEDWRNGRLYLPQDEMAAFGLTELDIEQGRLDARWQAFMAFQINRTRQLYAESLPGIDYLHGDGRFAIGAAAELYRAILLDIERHESDVFTRRAHVSKAGKLRRLPGIWWRSWMGFSME